jgi:CheY-like chemotaxis protein
MMTDSDQNVSIRNAEVLVVDDDPLHQTYLCIVLNILNIKPDICLNGESAVNALRSKKYDIVLMDIDMPVMNGYDATLSIRNELSLKTPIIAVSSNNSSHSKHQAKTCGMNDYLVKPFEPAKLIAMLSQYLEETEN